ncbi:MAG: hypothetical protein HOO88_08005 [Kiritimatiellaceae bacterium]|nr:hypothetical protein [Kiritimatiellaceae bacterium]
MSRNKVTDRVFISLLLAGTLFAGAASYGEDQLHDASLSVKSDKTQKQDRNRTTEQKPNASVTTTIETKTEACTLEITVGNSTKQNDSYLLEWFFISQKDEGTSADKLYIFGSGKAVVDLEGKAEITRTEASKPFIYTKKSIDRVGPGGGSGNATQTRGGDAYAGYIVLVKANGQILQKESNNARFLTDEWLAKCESAAKVSPPVKKKKQP